MTSISTILKFWVISVAILQITGRRGKAKKKHPKSSPIRAVQCPTKCHNFIEGNTVDSQLVREVKPGQFLAETRVATHCDTDCFEDCLKTQDPQNTQMISYTCDAKSSVCDYRENKECVKHVFDSDGEPLPWPYVEDDQAEEEQIEPEISEYSDDNCPVCMDSDLSDKMIGCMKNRYKTESCVAGDSCWVYDLSGSLSVNLLNGDPIVLEKVIKCQRDALPHQGCNNEKCTGNFRRVQEEIEKINNADYTSTPGLEIVTREMQTTQPATVPVISTEQEKDEYPATESQNNFIEESSTETVEIIVTVKSEPSEDSKEEISVKPTTKSNEETTVKQTTEANEETTVKQTTEANEETTVKQTTEANEETTVKQTTEANEETTVKQTTEAKEETTEKQTTEANEETTVKQTTEANDETTEKQTTEANEDTPVKQRTEPKLEGVANLTTAKDAAENPSTEPKQDTETTEVRYTTQPVKNTTEKSHVSFQTTTQPGPGPDDLKMDPGEEDIDNLAVDDRGVDDSDSDNAVVCSEEVQNCPDGLKCWGRMLNDGDQIDYVCSKSEPDCNGADGCDGTCMPGRITCVPISTTVPTSTESGEVTEKKPEDESSESSGEDKTNSVESLPKGDGLETNKTESNEINPNDDDDEILNPIIEEVSNTKGTDSRGESAKISTISLWLIASFLLLRNQA